MANITSLYDTIGLAKTEVDVHTLGITTIEDLLRESGFKVKVSGSDILKAFSNPSDANNSSLINKWIRENGITVLGFSYRLDPDDAVSIFRKLMYQLEYKNLMKRSGGPIKSVYFAGLLSACDRIKEIYGNQIGVFYGDETAIETLKILGIEPNLAPLNIVGTHPYDEALESFGKDIIRKSDYVSVAPVDRHTSKNFGTENEKVVDRIKHGRKTGLPPIIRAHAGPYLENREEAVNQFVDWSRQLAQTGLLDVLSIGTSQLTQERFGEDWEDLPNGGGVPINSPEEYRFIYNASRPMFVRTYAGTKNIPKLARMYEDTINIAWHALSLWWFSLLDGRGTNSVADNLKEHFETIRYIASTNKPYEPNVPHHFAFRGADDITYVASSVIAAKVAKELGINDFILQLMLNNPKQTWGVNDLAKVRATISLVRQLEDPSFRVYVQTRTGLNYLSHDVEKAKVQLAAVTALMDDIEPQNPSSPDIMHVVSHSEAIHLATPEIINESVQIARCSLEKYRRLRKNGEVDDMSNNVDVQNRMNYLVYGVRQILSTIEKKIKNPYNPKGLYEIFKAGFLPVPRLMYNRDEFPEAVRWQTKIRNGQVDIYKDNKILKPKERMEEILQK